MRLNWRYRLDEPLTYQHELFVGIQLNEPWLSIADGRISVPTGYAWDGCTPRFHLFGVGSIGIPNGTLRFGKPWTYDASCVHDALYQYKGHHGLTRAQADKIFDDHLRELKWPLRRIYVAAVRWFGPKW